MKPWNIPVDLDPECLQLCTALNGIEGIRTIESCCGHGKGPFKIWFLPRDLEALPELLYWFSACHCGFYDWQIVVSTDCVMSDASFCIKGPKGEEAYKEANKIAKLIENYLSEPK